MDQHIIDSIQALKKRFLVDDNERFEKLALTSSLIESELSQLKIKNGTNSHDFQEIEKLTSTLALEKAELETQRSILDKIKSQINCISEQKTKITNDIQSFKESNQSLEKEIQQLEHERAETNDHYQKLKYKCGLYRNAAGVCWDETTDNDRIQGFVIGNAALKPFNFNLKENSTIFTSHFIWKLINEDAE